MFKMRLLGYSILIMLALQIASRIYPLWYTYHWGEATFPATFQARNAHSDVTAVSLPRKWDCAILHRHRASMDS